MANILMITTLYPPFHLGGYDLRCRDIAEELIKNEHTVRVLVTRRGVKTKQIDNNIHRVLHSRFEKAGFIKRIIWDISDLSYIRAQIRRFKPDIIYLFHTMSIARTIFPFLSNLRIPIIYDEGGIGLLDAWNNHGTWIKFCERRSENRWKNLLKKVIVKALRLICGSLLPIHWAMPPMKVYFNSQYSLNRTLQAGVLLQDARVIYSGVDIGKFEFLKRNKLGNTIRFLFPGRIDKLKGIDSAIYAIANLKTIYPNYQFYLDIVGPIQDVAYYEQLQELINKNNLKENVTFIDIVDYEEMPTYYHKADFCLLFTKFESFSRVPLEAMACGSVVICSPVGGNKEIIEEGIDGFIVEPDDLETFRKIMELFIKRPELICEISYAARKKIENKYSFSKYMQQIESMIQETFGDANINSYKNRD